MRKYNIMSNINRIFALVWEQCLDLLQLTISLYMENEKKSENFDGVWLQKSVEENLTRVQN